MAHTYKCVALAAATLLFSCGERSEFVQNAEKFGESYVTSTMKDVETALEAQRVLGEPLSINETPSGQTAFLYSFGPEANPDCAGLVLEFDRDGALTEWNLVKHQTFP